MEIKNYLHNIILIISITAPCLSKKYYLLNFKPSNSSSAVKPNAAFKINCQKSDICSIQNGGWRYESNEWKFYERRLSRLCCFLETELAFPTNLPRPRKIELSLVINFETCTEFGSKCREELHIQGSLDETIKPSKEDLKIDKLVNRSFVPNNIEASIKLSFTAIRFKGVLKKVQVYFHYCPAVNLNRVEYPNMTINTSMDGQCISNAVVAGDSKPSSLCNPIGQSVLKGYCSCNKGFELSNDIKCVGRYLCRPLHYSVSGIRQNVLSRCK